MINYSFIIPHKNCPDLLQRCMDSIPVRDDVQVIVVDDNSDVDKRPSLKRDGLDVVFLYKDQSKGAGRARNVGMEKAVGKWLLFADCDDYYKNGFLDVLDEYKERDVDVVYFNFEYRDGNTGELLKPLSFRKDFDEYDGSEEARNRIKFHHNVPWTKMIKRDYLKINKIKFEEVVNGNDILFSMLVGYFAKNVIVEKKPLYIYLKNEGSLVNRKLSIETAFCKLTHRIKLNYFYQFVKHPEWEESAVMEMLYYSKKVGIIFPFVLLKKSYKLLKERKEWISIIKTITN